VADEILMAAFCDELEKVAASRSFFGKLPQIRLPNLLGKKPKVPSITPRRTSPGRGVAAGLPTGPVGPSFRSISRKYGLPPEKAIPMIRRAKQTARTTGRSAHDIFEGLAKGG